MLFKKANRRLCRKAQNYPDYDYDAEPLDHVNKRINNRHEIKSDEKVKSDPEKKRFLNKV